MSHQVFVDKMLSVLCTPMVFLAESSFVIARSKGHPSDTFAIAELFLNENEHLHDLLEKAVGWLLREAGKRDSERLANWLYPRASSMPRTMLRYAIEKFPETERQHYLKLSK